MLKKAGIVTAAAAGMMMLAAPAFATTAGSYNPHHGWDGGQANGQIGLINTGNIDILHNVSVPICATGNDVAVGLVPVIADVLSPKGTVGSCNSLIETGDSHN